MKSISKMFSMKALQKKMKFLMKPDNLTKILVLIVVLLLLALIYQNFLVKEGFVADSQDDLMSKVGDKKAMVLFHADWCGHCKNFMPVWDELSAHNDTQDKVVFIKAECGKPAENDEHKNMMNEYNIKGYPTLMVFNSKDEKPQEYTDERNKNAIEQYMGLN